MSGIITKTRAHFVCFLFKVSVVEDGDRARRLIVTRKQPL